MDTFHLLFLSLACTKGDTRHLLHLSHPFIGSRIDSHMPGFSFIPPSLIFFFLSHVCKHTCMHKYNPV